MVTSLLDMLGIAGRFFLDSLRRDFRPASLDERIVRVLVWAMLIFLSFAWASTRSSVEQCIHDDLDSCSSNLERSL